MTRNAIRASTGIRRSNCARSHPLHVRLDVRGRGFLCYRPRAPRPRMAARTDFFSGAGGLNSFFEIKQSNGDQYLNVVNGSRVSRSCSSAWRVDLFSVSAIGSDGGGGLKSLGPFHPGPVGRSVFSGAKLAEIFFFGARRICSSLRRFRGFENCREIHPGGVGGGQS
jgi:hypothetical protein